MITYQTLGSADGTPLVFIHGLGAGKKQISSALTNLPGRWLITPNMPGHGDSTDIDPALFSFDFFADGDPVKDVVPGRLGERVRAFVEPFA